MKARRKGHTQIVAAARAGISERSGRNIEQGKDRRTLITLARRGARPDPLEVVWDNELKLMLEQEPALTAITLLEYLQNKYPDSYPDKILRTLQRRVKQWQALYGPEREVMFRQTYEAGRQSLSDFTKLKNVTIYINGEPFNHLLYHFRLAFSRWSFMKVIQGGESYPALAQGLQEALKKLNGCPKEHRTDSLSAAFKNITRKDQEDLTAQYSELCRHYNMTATRNNRGRGHENGSIESPHGHLKRRIEQALLLRDNNHFKTVQDYQDFIDKVVIGSNRRNAKAIEDERQFLQPLPKNNVTDYSELKVVVTSSSTINVRRVTYTVPSRLQGEALNVRIYDDRLCCYLGAHHVITLQRLHLHKPKMYGRQVNYRHVVDSLVKKPQAFRYSQLRDDLLPNDTYRTIWTVVNEQLSALEACKFIVNLLHLASTYNCERELGETVLHSFNRGQLLSITALQKMFGNQQKNKHFNVQVTQHPLECYNYLIPQVVQEVCHA